MALVNPANFQCDKWSPVDADPKISNTNPQVALTHIFCGQIKANGEAEGLHYLPSASSKYGRVEEPITLTNALPCYKKEAVYNAKSSQWIYRVLSSGSKGFCFFPKDWSVVDTVNNLIATHRRCNPNQNVGTLCARRPYGAGFDIIIFLGNLSTGQRGIVSAFATPENAYNQGCTVCQPPAG